LRNDNSCNIKLKSPGEEFIVELPRNGEIYYIYPVIADVPFDNRESFFEFLPKLDSHGIETRQRNIGIEFQAKKFILSQRLLSQGLDEILLINLLNGFFTSVAKLLDEIKHVLQNQVSSVAPK
jgi:hypothetical protein